MAAYFLIGKYTPDAIKTISADRTNAAVDLIENAGGQVISKYVLLGDKDIVFIVDFPEIDRAIKASVGLYKLTGIAFSTSPAATAALCTMMPVATTVTSVPFRLTSARPNGIV